MDYFKQKGCVGKRVIDKKFNYDTEIEKQKWIDTSRRIILNGNNLN